MSNPILSWRRVRALCVKETRQIVRDPSSWLIAVVIPLLLLFIFGYGINLDSSKLRVGILLEQRSEAALDFTHTMTGSPYIDAIVATPWQLDADGMLPIPDAPGLGVTLDPDAVAKYTGDAGFMAGER